MGAGIAGRIHTRHATQGIHTDTAVVRYDQTGEHGRDTLGLDGGIGLKRSAGFLRIRRTGKISQSPELELRGQNAGKFAGFVGVAGGNEQGDAGHG